MFSETARDIDVKATAKCWDCHPPAHCVDSRRNTLAGSRTANHKQQKANTEIMFSETAEKQKVIETMQNKSPAVNYNQLTTKYNKLLPLPPHGSILMQPNPACS